MKLASNRGDCWSGYRGAFSLIELMVVLVLIGVMTAVIIPEMKGTFEDALLRSTSRKLVDAFNVANSRAITINQLHRVRIDRTQGRYILERKGHEGERGFVPLRDVSGAEGELDKRISIEIRKANDSAWDEPGAETSAVPRDDSVNSNPDEISFYPDGTADEAQIVLRDRDGFRLALRINPITARVHILELDRL